jgi:hypothetical protein
MRFGDIGTNAVAAKSQSSMGNAAARGTYIAIDGTPDDGMVPRPVLQR